MDLTVLDDLELLRTFAALLATDLLVCLVLAIKTTSFHNMILTLYHITNKVPREQTMNIVAENAKRIIDEKGIKYVYVAKRLGWSKVKLSRKLNGSWRMYWDDVMRIADALEVTPNDLYKKGE